MKYFADFPELPLGSTNFKEPRLDLWVINFQDSPIDYRHLLATYVIFVNIEEVSGENENVSIKSKAIRNHFEKFIHMSNYSSKLEMLNNFSNYVLVNYNGKISVSENIHTMILKDKTINIYHKFIVAEDKMSFKRKFIYRGIVSPKQKTITVYE